MEDLVRVKMAKLRNALSRDVRTRKQRSENLRGSFIASNSSIKSTAQDINANRVKLDKLKECLRNLQTKLSDALAVKINQEAKRAAAVESISTVNARIQLLEKKVNDQRVKKDDYTSIISQQQHVLKSLEEKSEDDLLEMKSIDDAIKWYKEMLGLSIEGGDGVKYTFRNINKENPNEQYTFMVRLDGDTYSLMNCDPDVEDVNTLMEDLNKTNGLFNFVRIMREKFKAAALNRKIPTSSSAMQASSSVTSCAPATSINLNAPYIQPTISRLKPQVATPSPQSLPNRRRSPRLSDKQMP